MYHTGHFITCPWHLSSSVIGPQDCERQHAFVTWGFEPKHYNTFLTSSSLGVWICLLITPSTGNIIWPNGQGQWQFSQSRRCQSPGYADSEMIHNDPNSYHRNVNPPVLCQVCGCVCVCMCGCVHLCVVQRSTCCKEENWYPNLSLEKTYQRPHWPTDLQVSTCQHWVFWNYVIWLNNSEWTKLVDAYRYILSKEITSYSDF